MALLGQLWHVIKAPFVLMLREVFNFFAACIEGDRVVN